jgi:hypothetical protein
MSMESKGFNPSEHMIDLKGKEYLQVMWRLVWFREEKPLWGIETEIIEVSAEQAIFRAEICDEGGNLKATGHGSETPKDFKDYIEKAETKAIGRALAMLGYGAQFAPELDEGERIVDSPAQKTRQARSTPQAKTDIRKKLTDEQVSKLVEVAGGAEGLNSALGKLGIKSVTQVAINGEDGFSKLLGAVKSKL